MRFGVRFRGFYCDGRAYNGGLGEGGDGHFGGGRRFSGCFCDLAAGGRLLGVGALSLTLRLRAGALTLCLRRLARCIRAGSILR